MKNIISFLLCIITAASPAFSQHFFTTKGKQILGTDGRPFLIRGTNLGNWLVPEGYMFRFDKTNSARLIDEMFKELAGPAKTKEFWKRFQDNYITEADIRYLKTIGMNSIRIPFHYKLFTREEYLGSTDSLRGFRLLDRVINWCRKEKLYVILDMHCAPGGQTGDNIDDSYGYPFLFEDTASQELACDIWKRIALHYRNDPVVIGYDLLNEPIPHFFDTARLNPRLEPLYKKLVKAVRAVDENHLVFLGGAQWDSNFRIFGQPFDDKAVYTFHKYWTDPTQEVIQDYVDFSNRYNVPLYCGETGENKDEWVKQFRDLLEKNGIGWHFWPYKKMNNKAGIVEFTIPEGFDAVIQFASSPRNSFEEIRKARPGNREKLLAAMDGLLKNCLFANCTPNTGYIKALGFSPDNGTVHNR